MAQEGARFASSGHRRTSKCLIPSDFSYTSPPPFLRPACLSAAAPYPVGTASEAIRRTMLPNSLRVKWLSASRSRQYRVYLEREIRTYESGLFVSSELAYLSAEGRTLVKQHCFARMDRNLTRELLRSIGGLEEYIEPGEVNAFIDPLVKAILYSRDAGLKEAAQEYVVRAFVITPEPNNRAWLKRLDEWIEHFKRQDRQEQAQRYRISRADPRTPSSRSNPVTWFHTSLGCRMARRFKGLGELSRLAAPTHWRALDRHPNGTAQQTTPCPVQAGERGERNGPARRAAPWSGRLPDATPKTAVFRWCTNVFRASSRYRLNPFSANRCSSSTILGYPTLQPLQLRSENPEKRV